MKPSCTREFHTHDDRRLSRRDWMKLTSAGVVGYSLSGWLASLAGGAARDPKRERSCILLWMNGGPSQLDTFDLKPGKDTGGPFKEIATASPGVRISEHLPKLAKWSERMAIIRSMSTKEGDHGRATFLMRTGRLPGGAVQYPSIGAALAHELTQGPAAAASGKPASQADLPPFVAIAPTRFFSPAAFGAGFLGPRFAPLIVGDSFGLGAVPRGDGPQSDPADQLKVPDLERPDGVTADQAAARLAMLREMNQDFLATHPGAPPLSHVAAYDRAVRLVTSKAAKAFDLSDEPAELRDAYGRTLFGQGCLLARRLVERGVPFVEVTLGSVEASPQGWDTHGQNFDSIKGLSAVLDPAWATLMQDLKDRDMLDDTLVVWMGEFGRTPKINAQRGRDHYPTAWSTVLAGGGIRGGQAYGRTSTDGTAVEENPVSVADLLCTVCHAVGVDPMHQNPSNNGRPIRIVDGGNAIKEVLA